MKLCIAQLLQDDDIDIRDMMAESVSNALGLSVSASWFCYMMNHLHYLDHGSSRACVGVDLSAFD